MTRGFIILMTLCTLAGCSDGEGSLDGSLGSVYRLGFDDVRVRLYSSELAIEYADNDGAVPLRVTLSRDALPETGGGEWQLEQDGAVTGQLRDGTYVPRFTRGSLIVDRYEPQEGATVQGSFTATFDTGRDELGLNGTFDTRLVLVTAPARPFE